MKITTIVKFILIIGSICLAIYLAFGLITNNITQKNDERSFCSQKCSYSPDSYLWEFSGEFSRKGFTTEEECLVYCYKSWEGFVYKVMSNSYASLSALPNFLKTFTK